MTQRTKSVGIGPGRGRTKYTVDLKPTDLKALERIGYFRSDWDRMNWYVRLAQIDPASLTNGEILSLQEEFVALEREVFAHYNPSSTNREQIHQLQEELYRALADLVDKGVTAIGPLTRIAQFVNPPMLAKQLGVKKGPDIHIPDRLYIYRPMETSGTHPLLHYFVQLLEDFTSSIRRCPHCFKLFLQFRRNAIYCSRSCQSVATMRKLREPKTDKRDSAKRKAKKGVNR